ncbi:heparinase II/III family protein [Pseudomonas sp.]|uniref:heparinase II/III family protein n=1 Tax=Pseudomonas sp. TaxID=306 RepID=UPI003A9783EA
MVLKKIHYLFRFYFTVRHLKVRQLFYRVYYRFRKVKFSAVSGIKKNNAFDIAHIYCWKSFEANDFQSFEFMGLKGGLDWHSSCRPKLWLYNLHYLDGLISCTPISLIEKSRLLNRWISSNPPFEGCGWEPYPLSLRIVNIVKWFHDQPSLQDGWLNSLATQTQALSVQVEYHVLANHLFANGKALVFAGSYFEGGQARAWLSQGLKILDAEIKEQFLTDGAHFELSPMYHASLLWDMCDLVNLASHTNIESLRSRIPSWKQIVEHGIVWLRDMQHPDGEIPFFNDSAFKIAPNLQQVEGYATSLGCLPANSNINPDSLHGVCHCESGYGAIYFGADCKALLNFSRIAPAYQPGHAHADTLSFELSLFGQRVFVNSGTSLYEDCPERLRQRGTAAHNTVEIDCENSSEVWAGFRVARRANVILEEFEVELDTVKFSCSHDGYARLHGKNIHFREWSARSNQLKITDRIAGKYCVAKSRLYVHPSAIVTLHGEHVVITMPSGQVIHVLFHGADKVNILESTWHPEFGVAIANKCIVTEFGGGALITTVDW